ncbi:PAP2-domain-containing protein [Sistotremastrum niveocremeum HHB9708]|uniref:Dolichyldiphosphatase n=1 Tax=Sistotremastrum niveocremeum HHB9708 TaxID=1314777 RepID=A0A164W6H9_9AGAM|nr:PAP2-domain-containing protein [Sistotremastrum niveocremeum HHB9708]
MSDDQIPRASLDVSHVLYDANSHVSLALALITLSPILIMPAYASAALLTRELVIIEMWLGQFACEGANWILKRMIKQERPLESAGQGYGFPSSHSQYMGYFATFLCCHFIFRHRFSSLGHPFIDFIRTSAVHAIIITWAGLVCYSRYHLTYHTVPQVMWGATFGVILGAAYYAVCELLPTAYPNSIFGQYRRALLDSVVASWFLIRDSWEVWPDGGYDQQWQSWKIQSVAQNQTRLKEKTK